MSSSRPTDRWGPASRARATSGVALFINAGTAAVALAGGVLGQLVGLTPPLLIATAFTILCVRPTALTPLHSLRAVPAA